jgi:protein-disulfide isomerase
MKRILRVIACAALTLSAASNCACAAPQAAQVGGDNPAVSIQPALAWQIEVAVRAHATLPPEAQVHVGHLSPGPLPGYDLVEVNVTSPTQSYRPISFLISADRTRLMEYRQLALDPDPRSSVASLDRPSRGGPASAPVLIINFDDLECPFCAQFNRTLFPAVIAKYKDQVRIVDLDFPSEGHPWALHAAIDVGCLAAQSSDAYWQSVDEIHSELHLIDVPENTVDNASRTIDSIIRKVGEQRKLNLPTLNACIQQQDSEGVAASVREGNSVNVGRTPTIFINGAKVEGTVPLPFLYQMIDSALLAQGKTLSH